MTRLRLAMGIIDLKYSEAGEPVWFEVNPQGQFLFLENLAQQRLLNKFCDFLVSDDDPFGATTPCAATNISPVVNLNSARDKRT